MQYTYVRLCFKYGTTEHVYLRSLTLGTSGISEVATSFKVVLSASLEGTFTMDEAEEDKPELGRGTGGMSLSSDCKVALDRLLLSRPRDSS